MTLRSQTLAFTALLLGALILVVHLFLGKNLLAGFAEAEKQEMVSRTIEVRRLIERRTQALDPLCHDWACWDEVYQFVVDRNPGFIARKVGPDLPGIVATRMVVIADRQGRVAFARWFSDDGVTSPVPAEVIAAIRPGGSLFPAATREGRRVGLLVTRAKGLVKAAVESI